VAKGDQISEAQAAADYLIRKKVPETVLVVLAEGSTTEQSVIAAADWCKARGIREVVVVSDPFHMLRVRLEMRRRGITAWTSPTRTSPISARRTGSSVSHGEAWKVVVAEAGVVGRRTADGQMGRWADGQMETYDRRSLDPARVGPPCG
jgi:vancomycin permeability regulator SanA